MMEINLYTCELVRIGLNITAIIKCQGKPILQFNCKTKYVDTAMKGVEEVMRKIDFWGASIESDYEPECVKLGDSVL